MTSINNAPKKCIKSFNTSPKNIKKLIKWMKNNDHHMVDGVLRDIRLYGRRSKCIDDIAHHPSFYKQLCYYSNVDIFELFLKHWGNTLIGSYDLLCHLLDVFTAHTSNDDKYLEMGLIKLKSALNIVEEFNRIDEPWNEFRYKMYITIALNRAQFALAIAIADFANIKIYDIPPWEEQVYFHRMDNRQLIRSVSDEIQKYLIHPGINRDAIIEYIERANHDNVEVDQRFLKILVEIDHPTYDNLIEDMLRVRHSHGDEMPNINVRFAHREKIKAMWKKIAVEASNKMDNQCT